MEQGPVLQHSMPMHTDFPIPSPHDCVDHYASQQTPGAPYQSQSLDHLRRDVNLPQHGHQTHQPLLHYNSGSNGQIRYISDRGIHADASGSYTQSHPFADSTSASISTSPSSAASTLLYTNYPPTTYNGLPAFTGAVSQPQTFVTTSYASARAPPPLDHSGSGMLPLPLRSPISSVLHSSDRDAYAAAAAVNASYPPRPLLSPNPHTGYHPCPPDTPRAVLNGPGYALSPGPNVFGHPSMATPTGAYGMTQSDSCSNFPWPSLEVLVDLTCDGQDVTPEVHAKVEKGLFFSAVDQKWTCYRRNYFSVVGSFELHPHMPNGRLYLKRNNGQEAIQAMGMRLSAAVDGSNGKNIELIQHTPKRDSGPKTKVDVIKVAPTLPGGRNDSTISSHGIYPVAMSAYHTTGSAPGPYLPLQLSPDGQEGSSSSAPVQHLSTQYPYSPSAHVAPQGQNVSHTFERIQFKQATANNGKRRASQQYFHLIVELFADVRKDGSDNAAWVKIAQRVSDKIVVRGRSPSHYQNEGQHGQPGRNGSTGGSSNFGAGGGNTFGGLNSGAFRSSHAGYPPMAGNSGHRSGRYDSHTTPDGSDSSVDSVHDGAIDPERPPQNVMGEVGRGGVHDANDYHYYPATIYEGAAQQQVLPPLQKVEGVGRPLTDPRQHAMRSDYGEAMPGMQWQSAQCGRFQGVESSKGYFPDLPAGFN